MVNKTIDRHPNHVHPPLHHKYHFYLYYLAPTLVEDLCSESIYVVLLPNLSLSKGCKIN